MSSFAQIPTLDDYVAEPYVQEEIRAADGYPLTARVYTPPATVRGSWHGSVLIVPAMGVPQAYYQPFATWLANHGYLAMTFDYRGMGLSKRGSLRDVDADVLTWAQQDAAAALEALSARGPALPVTWVGHSLGGQILPFVPNRARVAKMITVGTGSGYWKENSPQLKRSVWLLWYGVAPLTMPLFGYFPGRLFNMVGDLPRGVMTQWRRWCLDPEYAVGAEGEAARAAFSSLKTPIVSLSFTDDEFMSAANTASIHGFYSGAPKAMIRIDPRDAGLKRIGHFGFFRRDMADPLWAKYVLPVLP
ncbi:MAG: alpha/beta fold hydrolase [Pseudomonadota bacterium]